MAKSKPIEAGQENRFTYLLNKYSPLILAASLLLGLILRILALMSLKGSIYFDFPLWDEQVYHDWAIKIAKGTPVLSTYGFAPFPAYLMALIYKIFSPDILYIRIMNILFGVLTCYTIYFIGKELVNRTVGLFACLIATLYEPFIFYSIVPLKTSLSIFLFALTICLFLAILNRYSMIKALLLGLVLGLMLNVRPNCIVIIPFLPLLFIWNMYKGGASGKVIAGSFLLYFGGILLSISPFIIKNFQDSGELRLTTGQAGYALYMGNNLENPDPYFRPVPFASSSPYEQGTQMIIEASRRAGKKLSSKEASRYWAQETMEAALEQPKAFAWKICQKILVLFNQFEAGDHYHIGFLSDFVKFFKMPFLNLWLILPFGMAGLVISMFGSRKTFAIGVIFSLYALTMVLFYTSTRFRLPLLVILVPFAVSGLQSLFTNIRSRQLKKVGFYGVFVCLFVVVEFLPVRATDDLTPYYNTHAIILSSKGYEAEAVKYWEEASRKDTPVSAYVNVTLAGEYYGKGDTQKALSYLDKIPDKSFAASYKYEIMGDIMLVEGQIEKAISAYQRSLEINYGRIDLREKLIRIYWKIDREKAMQEYNRLEYILSFYPKDASGS